MHNLNAYLSSRTLRPNKRSSQVSAQKTDPPYPLAMGQHKTLKRRWGSIAAEGPSELAHSLWRATSPESLIVIRFAQCLIGTARSLNTNRAGQGGAKNLCHPSILTNATGGLCPERPELEARRGTVPVLSRIR